MTKSTRVVWGEYRDPALIKDEYGNLYEWRILQVDPARFDGCDYIFGLKKLER